MNQPQDENSNELSAPHQTIETNSLQEKFVLELFDALWKRYRDRVEYVQRYESVVQELGGTFVNDHIAFRTIACQRPTTGIVTLSRIFEALGYQAAGCYHFPDKHLNSLHFQHPNAKFPKLFISELRTWELPLNARKTLTQTVAKHRKIIRDDTLNGLYFLDKQNPVTQAQLLKQLIKFFHKLPWEPPRKRDVEAVNEVSQFGAWGLVHGYHVNHFTALINSHGVPELNSIEKTIERLQLAGVPMKAEIEGAPGSKLRQTATEAVVLDVDVRRGKKTSTFPWTYAYFELAERGTIPLPDGTETRFEGFLGPQATNLFDMTQVK